MNIIRKIFHYFYKPQIYVHFNPPIYYLLRNRGWIMNAIRGILPLHFKMRFMQLVVNERIVEIPFMYKNLGLQEGAKILEIGCSESKVSLELASLGYKVIGYDLRDYDFVHPNFKFIKGNFLKNSLPEEHFDCVLAISTIEHCGLELYGAKAFEDGDKKIINEIYRVLKRGGIFIITVPFGIKKQYYFYRVYDHKSLQILLRDFEFIEERYYKCIDRRFWVPETKENLSNIDSCSEGYTKAVACIVCKKS